MSFWDNPELARASNYISFANVGDTVTGIVTALRTQTFSENGITKTVPQIDLATQDGPRTMTCGQTRLQLALLERRPDIGDELTVAFVGEERRPGGKALKSFSVTVSRGGTIVEQPAQPQQAEQQDLGLI